MDRFSKEAAEWDKNPDINLINDHVASAVLPAILSPTDSVLELGCGTGLLTLRAYRSVSSWFGVDTAEGMIAMLRAKIDSQPGVRDTVSAATLFLERPDQLRRRYDWAVSAMTFHHIPDMQRTITCLAGSVDRGLVIVDYLAWDGAIVFHPDDKMEGVERHGLRAEEMESMCRAAGFKTVETRIGFTLTLRRKGEDVVFPFLVVEARH